MSARARSAPPAPAPRPAGRGLHRLAFVVAALLFLALPLAFDPRIGGQFRIVKAMLAQTLGLASLLLLVLGARRIDPPALRRALASPAATAVAPLLVVAPLVSLASSHPEHVARGLAGFCIAGACLLGWSWGFGRAELARLLAWTLPGAVASALLAVVQAAGLYQPFALAQEGTTPQERFEVIGFAGNPGDLAMSLVVPCLWAQAAAAGAAARARLALGLAAAACALGVLASQTVTAIAALALGSALFWLPRLARRDWRALAAGAAVVALLTAVWAPARARVVAKLGDLARGDWNELLTGRLDGWRAAVEMFAEHPSTGVGQGAYRAEYVDAKVALVDRGARFYERQPYPVFANAHCEPLEVAAETGLPGLVALGWALWVIGQRLAGESFRDRRRERSLAGAGVAALGLLALVGFPFRIALAGYPALLFLAWLLADPADPEPT